MSTITNYQDLDGNPISLYKLVRTEPNWAASRIDFMNNQVAKLETELETERCRLVACGVVSLANTRCSAKKQRIMSPKYHSTSLDDVIRAVDSEMDLRDKNENLEKERGVYASAFHQLKGEFVRCDNCGNQSECKDFDIFNGGTVDWLQSDRDLNQQADGIESLITSGGSIEQSSMNSFYRREATKLRNQAKALKEGK
jgi:hypothetical protein